MLDEYYMEPFTLSDSIGYFFCGSITLLLFFVLIVYLKTKESIYLYYVLFLFFILFYAFIVLKEIYGINHAFLEYIHKNRRYIEPVTILSFSFYIFFAIKLVNIHPQRPLLAFKLLVFGLVCVVYSLLYFIFFEYIEPHFLIIFIIARIVIFILCSYFLINIYRHILSPVKLFFITGSIFYFVGSIVASLRFSGIYIPLDIFYAFTAPSYFQIGIMMQALFFALALGERIIFKHQEHDSAQRVLIEQLAIKERVTKEVNERLEEEIEERVREMMVIKENLQEQERMRLTAEFERNLIKSEITAKRAQISPHFMFNSLNAIKYLILQKENDKATKYLTTFSRFIRSVLERVDKDLIPLETEISILHDYLELEKKRFDSDFMFNLRISPSVILNNYYFPPLLLQPFVENAIWHGLLTSDKKKKLLTIEVEPIKSGIKIVIEDNGVGRHRTLSKTSKSQNKSKGHSLTMERIELFNHNNKIRQISLKITDLYDKKQAPLGTKVELFVEDKKTNKAKV